MDAIGSTPMHRCCKTYDCHVCERMAGTTADHYHGSSGHRLPPCAVQLPESLNPYTSSTLLQHQIHRPAPPHMRPRPAQVAEQIGVGAAGVLQGVGEQARAVERAV